MARFDFIEAANSAYSFIWSQRHAVLHLARIPLIVKLASFLLVTALVTDDNFLRQGLLLLPSYFAEGWLAVVLIRAAVLGEKPPSSPPVSVKEFTAATTPESHAVLAATIIYVLTKLLLSFFSALVMEQQAALPATASPEAGFSALAVATIILGLIIWCFKFLWLYVPAALGYGIESFMEKTRSYLVSFRMIALWLVCFIPVAVIMLIIFQILGGILPENGAGEIPALFQYLIAIIQAVLEMAIVVLSSIAMGFAVKQLYSDKGRKP